MKTRFPKVSCKYCGLTTTKQVIGRHEATCKENPHPNFTVNDKWKASFASNKKNHKPMGGAHHTTEGLRKLSEAAKRNGLGGHTSKVKLYYKMKTGEEVWLQSSYEIRLATILDDLGVHWERPAPLIWTDNEGKDHRYYPDFKIGNLYLDTKNDFLAIKDATKIEAVKKQNSIDLRIIVNEQITKEYIAGIV